MALIQITWRFGDTRIVEEFVIPNKISLQNLEKDENKPPIYVL